MAIMAISSNSSIENFFLACSPTPDASGKRGAFAATVSVNYRIS